MTRSLFFLLLISGAAATAEPGPIAYPNGYREWLHVKTVHLKPGHPLYHTFPGIHHIYANQKAVEGMKRGKFPNGATFVLDLMEARDEGFAVSEGPRKLVAVMNKNLTRYPATGGWGYEAFLGDSRKERVGRNVLADCAACHAGQQARDYVFSAPEPVLRKKGRK